ncbi:MAG TPA: rhodanese-like domain-containing protein [Rhodocyclaceae bacterium]
MEFIQENITWVMLAVVSGGMLLWSMAKGTGGISVAEATNLINREDGIVLDVRESNEWTTGHIPNARHIALGQLAGHISELEKLKDKPIIVCCASGNRSSSACATLTKAGFGRVFNLAGGIGAWRDAGLPVTTKH